MYIDYILGFVIIVIIAIFIISYNVLTGLRQKVSEAWADIDVQLKRRHDLIPNLIDTVKGYAAHEQTVFEQVTKLREEAMNGNPQDIAQRAAVEDNLEKNVHQLLAIGENYPDLKANENFLKLQDELTATEDEIASARRIYNDNVADYNTKISTIPNNFIASVSKFQPAAFFQNQ